MSKECYAVVEGRGPFRLPPIYARMSRLNHSAPPTPGYHHTMRTIRSSAARDYKPCKHGVALGPHLGTV